MLFEVMRHCRNYFPTGKRAEGRFAIENGTINLSFVKTGQYVLIEGSTMNDGVYQYPITGLQDEEFSGCVSVLAPTQAFLKLVDEISEWCEKNADRGAFQSESFGGYSYARATNAEGAQIDWSDAFKQRLNVWRKL